GLDALVVAVEHLAAADVRALHHLHGVLHAVGQLLAHLDHVAGSVPGLAAAAALTAPISGGTPAPGTSWALAARPPDKATRRSAAPVSRAPATVCPHGRGGAERRHLSDWPASGLGDVPSAPHCGQVTIGSARRGSEPPACLLGSRRGRGGGARRVV